MRIFIFPVMIFFHISIIGQILTVRDSETNQPLALVNLYSSLPEATGLTDVNGQVNINRFRESKKIEIRLLGYKTETLSFSELEEINFLLYLKQEAVTLDQVVVSATRWKQSRREIPAKITGITPRQVELFNPQTAADLLTLSGEVFVQKSQLGGGSPIIRGFAANRLLIAVDGVRMNTAIFRSGNLQNVISLDPFSIERTEIFFGPGSVIYGSDAIGGVMSFSSLTPKLSSGESIFISGKSSIRYSTANQEKTGNLNLNIGFSNWGFVTSYTHFNYSDLKMGNNGPDEYLSKYYVERKNDEDIVIENPDPLIQKPTGYSQNNFMQKILFKPNEDLEIQYGFHYSATGDYSRYDRLLRLRNNLPRSAEWYYGPQIWMMNNLTFSDNKSKALYDNFTTRLAYQYFEESRIDRDLNKPIRAKRTEEVRAYSLNTDFSRSFSESDILYYGAELIYNNVKSSGIDENILTGESITGPSRYPQADWYSFGLYINYSKKLDKEFTLQSGLRYSHFIIDALFDTTFYPFPFTDTELSFGSLTGSIGAVYNPVKDFTLNFNLSTGFRAPNIDDVGKVFDSEPGSVVIPNPNLNPEYAYNAEFGIAKIFGSSLKADVSFYYTYLTDALVRRNSKLNGADSILYSGELSQVQSIQNGAFAFVTGFNAGLEYKSNSGFGALLQINYQFGEEELDDGSKNPLRHAAPWYGAFHINYSTGKLLVDVYSHFSGEISFENMPLSEIEKDYLYAKDISGNPYSPAWFTLNMKAGYRVSPNVSLNLGIENILDKRYRPYSSGIAGPGRNFVISLLGNI